MAEEANTNEAAKPSISNNTSNLPNTSSPTSSPSKNLYSPTKPRSKIVGAIVLPASEATDGKQRFGCPVEGCTKTYSRSDHLRSHMVWHSGEKPYKCDHPTCEKAFLRSDQLLRHYHIHTGEKNVQCPHCIKKFYRSDHLTKHLNVHFKNPTIDISELLEVTMDKGSGSSSSDVSPEKDILSRSQIPVELEEHGKEEVDTDAKCNNRLDDENNMMSEIKIEPEVLSETKNTSHD